MKLGALLLAIGLASGLAVVGCEKKEKKKTHKRSKQANKDKKEVNDLIKEASKKAADKVNADGGNVTQAEQDSFVSSTQEGYDKMIELQGEQEATVTFDALVTQAAQDELSNLSADPEEQVEVLLPNASPVEQDSAIKLIEELKDGSLDKEQATEALKEIGDAIKVEDIPSPSDIDS